MRFNAHESKMTELNCDISIISRSYWIHAPNEMYPCTDNTPRISECTQHQRTENIIWFTLSHVVYRFNMFRYKHFFSESVVVVEYQSRGEVSRLVMELELSVNSSR